VILWDGGNNDISFYETGLHIVLVDPHRPRHEVLYYPGETNLRLADVVLVAKIGTADPKNIEIVEQSARELNPDAKIIRADSVVNVSDPSQVAGKKVLVVEDGPTLTHGEMTYGAGHVAAKKFGAAEIIDPRPYAVGSIKETFEKYPHVTDVLPAMGYGDTQTSELQQTINAVPCDLVIVGTPFDLGRLIEVDKPMSRVTYELDDAASLELEKLIDAYLG